MDQGSLRRGKFIFVGLPFLLLIAYIIFIPAPTITQIEIKNNIGYLADGYNFRIVQVSPQGGVAPLSRNSFEIFDSTVRKFIIDTNLNLAYVITGDGLVSIITIADPSNPNKLTYFDTPGFPQSVAINGNFAYVADGPTGIQIVSLLEITRPRIITSIGDLGFVSDIFQIGNLTYVSRGEQGLDIYDLSNYSKPMLVGHYDAGGLIRQTTFEKVRDDNGREWIKATLLVAQRAVQIVDFTNPGQPSLLNSYDFDTSSITKALVRNKLIFTAQTEGGVLVSRVDDDGNMEQLASITGPRTLYDFAIQDNIAFWAGGFEGVQAYDFSDLKSIRIAGSPYSNFWKFKIWIAVLSIAFLLLWLVFFAQFVLPVRTFRQRQKIFDRLITYLLGRHGPALFVENGLIKEHSGERLKKGPGVVWLDTASAAVIRTATKFREAIGPGVHFTERGEFLTDPVDLHIQSEALGPREHEKPFDEKKENQTDEMYNEIQKNRMMTSALTRDGIEVVPKINVVFRVDTKPTIGNQQSGSRFGYRTGTSREEREMEEEDKKAIYNAIVGEGIDPTVPGELHRHRVAWNQLPGRLAVDVWREYVSKFTLDELFQPSQPVRHPLPELLNTGLQVPENKKMSENEKPQPITEVNGIDGILSEFNRLLSNFADWLEGREKKQSVDTINTNVAPGQSSKIIQNNSVPENQTALQLINEMVKKRLTQPETERLGNTGELVPGEYQHNKEYDLLQKRSLKVINVNISNLQFSKKVEDQIVSQWTANWFNNAKAERERIERRQKFVEMSGEEEAANEYVHTLARHFVLVGTNDAREALRALLMRSRLVIARDNQLQNRMSTEWQYIEDILRWLEYRQ